MAMQVLWVKGLRYETRIDGVDVFDTKSAIAYRYIHAVQFAFAHVLQIASSSTFSL